MYPSSYSLSTKRPPPKYSDFTGYGWIIVTCSFILYLIVDGIAYNLGLINSAWLAEFKQSETATSWIGSIFYSVPLLSAPITAQLVEKFGCKTITIICSIISTFGFVMSSFCGSIEQLYLTVGLIAGFGASAAYVVGILSAERWFEKNRTLAIGIVSSGTGFGTFLIAPITQRLLDAYGWRNVMYFLASLNVLMGFVGCFIREPLWVIEEMEKKGIREPKKSESHGIFEEHETSFGTFRRLSIEAIDDIKDVVRGHFSEHYSHLEEVVEEKVVNFDNFEEIVRESEDVNNIDAVATSKGEVRLITGPESEIMSLNLLQNEVEPSKSQYNLVTTTNTTSEIPKNQQSEVMLQHTTTVLQSNITNLQHTPFRHNIEQQIIVHDSQEHSNLENSINIMKTETNTSSSANVDSHTSHQEIENERMTVQLPQTEDEDYQEENSGEHCDDCHCMSKNDLRSKFGSGGLQSVSKVDQVFTISGQDLKNNPENLKICQHNGNNLKNRHSTIEINNNFQNHSFENKFSKSDPNLGAGIKVAKSYHFSNSNNHQLPSYTQVCYNFQNQDTNNLQPSPQPPKKPQISTTILEFIKNKFKVVKKLFSHFSNRDFTLLAISTFAIYSLYNIPIYFIIELLKNYGYTEPQCANYISLIGISILIGMITLGYIGDVSGNHVKNVNALCVLVCGISEILLPSCADNSITFGICCFFFGFSFASAYVLIPKIAEMIVGVEAFASAIGLNFFVQGLALLVGIPFASTIYEAIGRNLGIIE
ncbi:unnamed protein product [Chironomus riparius]|uniref:Monocarboxylate transporter n=1 Tax=Chironomus riparius TaxID=315576 RepID=A0A9P0JBR5_9DIPT|nr:unnamed protein product [Chironomus riparius]